ncbi:MAG: selenocysteine-specific translation elongation factor, partial [Myxococcota bacterium]
QGAQARAARARSNARALGFGNGLMRPAGRVATPGRPTSIILGTAGHIDHGKTSLVRALTGIDTDRLPEEKQRGITIELGFAHLEIENFRFGVVDVPGHERFVRAMVAGAGGIDLVMLVIAADEGVMPQTREHLDICELLAVPRGLVVLTKVDACEPDWLELVTEDVRKALAGTFLHDAPIVPVSAHTGAGLDDLRNTIVTIAGEVPPKDPDGLFRLPLDRVFTMKGFGTVVTGTLVAGRVRVGDDVVCLPSGVPAKVRGLQVHGGAVEEAFAGQRTAVNLQGPEREQVARGEVLAHPGTLAPCAILDGALRYLRVCKRPLKSRARVLFHTGTTQVMGSLVLVEGKEILPGDQGLVQLHLDEPVVVLPGDRFILRGFETQENYGTTLGGGEVVRALAPKLRRPSAEAATLLRAMRAADPTSRVALEVAAAGPAGLDRAELAARLSSTPRALDRALDALSSKGVLVRFDREKGAVVHRDAFAALARRVVDEVERFHAEQPLRAGVAREEVRSKLEGVAPKLFHAACEDLIARGELSADRETVRRPSHQAKAAAAGLAPLKARIATRLREAALSPPRPAELCADLGAGERDVSDALRLLVEERAACKVADLWFDREAVDALRARLAAFLAKQGAITPQQWKELCGATRKFSIPLAEHFDAEKLTVRVGETRKLRGR